VFVSDGAVTGVSFGAVASDEPGDLEPVLADAVGRTGRLLRRRAARVLGRHRAAARVGVRARGVGPDRRHPYGETRSYGRIAHAVGEPGGAQAVGLACNRNPLPLIIPCHRVIGSDGKLVGFGGGLHRKRWLLQLEARISIEHAFG
jgi:methylated-DNA-[protein]-cysteine S-methyltransferase